MMVTNPPDLNQRELGSQGRNCLFKSCHIFSGDVHLICKGMGVVPLPIHVVEGDCEYALRLSQ